MFEATGPLKIVEPLSSVGLLVSLPLLWAVVGLAAGSAASHRARVVRIVALLFAASTLTVALGLSFRALRAHHALVLDLPSIARFGQLDMGFELSLDAVAVPFVLVASVVGVASVLDRIARRENAGLAAAGALTFATNLVALAGGFGPLLVGLGTATIAVIALRRERASAVIAVGGDVALAIGVTILYWALGGSLGPSGYDPDAAPRFALVARQVTDLPPGKAELSMTTYRRALVSTDDGPDLPSEPVAAPFRLAIDPGPYSFRIQPGVASPDAVVSHVTLAAGRSYVLVPYGPATSFRELTDQIAAPRQPALRASLERRGVLGVRASLAIILFVALGVLARAFAAVRTGASEEIGTRVLPALILEVVPIAVVVLRVAPILEPHGGDAAALAILGALAAVVLGARAATMTDSRAMVTAGAAVASCVAVAAVGLGVPAAALALVPPAILAAAAALAALDGGRDVRWLGVACAAGAGLLPGTGTSAGQILLLFAALRHAGDPKSDLQREATVVAAAAVLAGVLAAIAAFRVYDASIRVDRGIRTESQRAALEIGTRLGGLIAIVLATLAIASGVVLGAGTTTFGGRLVPFAERALDVKPDLTPSAGVAAAALGLALAAAVGGALLARSGAAGGSSALARALELPGRGLAWTGGALVSGTRFFSRAVVVMDRDVLGDVVTVAGDALGSLVRVVARVDRERVPSLGGRLLERIGLDEPKRLATAASVLVMVLVALLSLVVFSSLFLV